MKRPFDENDPAPIESHEHRHKEPKALKRLRKLFTYDKQLAVFRLKYNREPASETELKVFCEHHLIGIYNGGFYTI